MGASYRRFLAGCVLLRTGIRALTAGREKHESRQVVAVKRRRRGIDDSISRRFPRLASLRNGHPNLAWRNSRIQKRRVPDLDANRCHSRLPLDPGNKGAYALRRMEGDTAHFLMVTFWESEDAIRAFAGHDITVAKYYDFDKDFLIELEACSTPLH
jgi:hypothetical protein